MNVLNDSDLPLIFKGALVLFRAKSSDIVVRGTNDIDCDWIVDPPTNSIIEKRLNEVAQKKLPNISFVLIREYEIGKKSAGFEILKDNVPVATMDMSIKAATSARMYYYGEYCFYGYDLMNIVSDKISVLSSKKIARRIKDLIDIFNYNWR